MTTVSKEIVYALLPATVLKQEASWIKIETDVISLGSFHRDGTPRRRLSNIRAAFASYAIVDRYGYFIKRPAREVIGDSAVRLFSNGLDWLDSNSILVSDDALKVALTRFSLNKEKIELSSVLKSNPTDLSKAFKDFLTYLLPKGVPVQF